MTETKLLPLGGTTFPPETFFFWQPDNHTTIEITPLQQNESFLIAGSKTYRLTKQSEDGRETRQKKLGQLTDYLETQFTHFQITVNYADHTTDTLTQIPDETRPLIEDAKQLVQQKHELVQKIENLEKAVKHGFDHLQDELAQRLDTKQQEYEAIETRLEELEQYIYEERQRLEQWRENGQSLAYLFTFTTQPQLTHYTELQTALEHTVEAAQDSGHGIQQALEGPNMQIWTEEMQEPRLIHRREHTSLHVPESLKKLEKQAPQELEPAIEELHKQHLTQYISYSPVDLETENGLFERGKQTPSKAVQTLLHKLDTVENLTTDGDIPNNGPHIGTVAGTQHLVGFDPADYRDHGLVHYYIVGGTGSGKTYFKRVLIENAASQGYDILTVTPTEGDYQAVGLNHPNHRHENGTGIEVSQYLANDPRLLNPLKTATDQLLTGVNAVSLDTLPDADKQAFINQVFKHLDGISHRDTPLFVCLDEAHRFADGPALNIMEKISREGRKFNIHLVLATQEPTDFSHSGSTLRNQLPHLFMKGRFTSYADAHLEADVDITTLETGQAIIDDWDYSTTVVDIRRPVTEVIEPDQGDDPNEHIAQIDQQYTQQTDLADNLPNQTTDTQMETEKSAENTAVEPENGAGNRLAEKEEAVFEWIQQFNEENDDWPTGSQTYNKGPANAGDYKQRLQTLRNHGLIEETEVERNNGTYTGYKITDDRHQ